MSDHQPVEDGEDAPDDLDGCSIDFAAEADDDETVALRPLFPDGDPAKADEWKALFNEGEG